MSLLVSSFRQSFMQMSPPAKLMLVVFLFLLFLILGSVAAFLLSIPFYHYDLLTLSGIMKSPDAGNINVIKFFQIFQSVFMFIIPAMLAAWLFSETAFTYLKADRKASVITLLMVLIMLIVAVPMLNEVSVINSRLDLPAWLDWLENKIRASEDSADRLTKLFLVSDTNMDLAVNFLMIAILPAIGEEFLFRGVLQRLLIDWTKSSHIGVISAAFIFSFIHFQFYGFVPRLLLGLCFGYLMVWSSSIWVPVAGHLINNGMAVIFYHFTTKPMGETPLDTIGTGGNGNYVLYLSVFFTCLLLGMIYQHEKRDRVSS
jgi:membrane protease YdiL (CAAX protease family)